MDSLDFWPKDLRLDSVVLCKSFLDEIVDMIIF